MEEILEEAECDEKFSHPRVRPEHFYGSFDEIDTSKLELITGVMVDGVEYVWFGEDMAGTTNGFIKAGSNNGQHIVADFELTGNIIGY